MRSLRARLLLGSILWTIGLLVVTNFVILGMMLHRIPGEVVHIVAMSVAGVGFLVVGLLHLRSVLGPFHRLREQLGRVRAGQSPRVEGAFPTEVAPVVTDLNALLDHRSRLVDRAIARSGDLAHGLKTPLAVLSQEAERLSAAGHPEQAAVIGQEVERMRRQIDYHLAHARAAASGSTLGARCSVLESAEGIARTLRRLHAEKGMAIEVSIPEAQCVRVQREDLDEMLGNLLDNACKWGRSKVRIESREGASGIIIAVEDDGGGIPPDLRERVLQRGVRADEKGTGSGFGLAIVADLAELYGGSIRLQSSTTGGVRALLTLPPPLDGHVD